MHTKSALASSILIFSTIAMAAQTVTVVQTEQYTSYSVVDTVTLTGSQPTESQTISIPPSQTPLTTITSALPSHSSGSVATRYSVSVTTPIGNATIPTHTAPKSTSTMATASGAAAGGFSGSFGISAAVGIAVAIIGSL